MYKEKLDVNLQKCKGHRFFKFLREFDLNKSTLHFVIYFSSFLSIQMTFLQDQASQKLTF